MISKIFILRILLYKYWPQVLNEQPNVIELRPYPSKRFVFVFSFNYSEIRAQNTTIETVSKSCINISLEWEDFLFYVEMS